MDLLLLGGTVFLGRELASEGLRRGHRVSLFTRGRHGADLFPEAEHLVGDRDGDLRALEGRRWDAVVDTSGYVPRVVGDAARLLAGAVGTYCFVSTLSVLDPAVVGADESTPTLPLPEGDRDAEEVTPERYGPLKAACERVVLDVAGTRASVIRPGLIVGPWDLSARFAYWPVRFARGGEVLVPAPPGARLQFIDVRDLAAWTLDGLERGLSGMFNATGPAGVLTMAELVEACIAGAPAGTAPVWVDEAFLLEAQVRPWAELPLWIPQDPEMAGFATADCAKAIAAGLRFRPLRETVSATLEWAQDHPALALPAGSAALTTEREEELLVRWRSAGRGAP